MAKRRPAPSTLQRYLKGPPRVTQRTLARKVGVHQSLISMLKRKERAAGGALALRLHRVTGVPLEELLRGPRRRPATIDHDEPESTTTTTTEVPRDDDDDASLRHLVH